MPKTRLPAMAFSIAILSLAPTFAQVYPASEPVNRAAAGAYSLRNIALGEPRFANPDLYNLYDQGGSPMGLLETHKERLGLTLGLLGGDRATEGDSLAMGHHDYYLPQLAFFQPGVFGAVLYFQRESETYQRLGGDSLDFGASRFGLDLAAGPASGLFRFGFSAHARMGEMEYPGDDKRVVMEVPSLRFDLGSRLHPAVEAGVFAGFGGHFDSLEASVARLERVASMTLPRYGAVADLGGTPELPMLGNLVFEMGTDRFFGEYKQANGTGIQYPIVWTKYWTFQTQWMYPVDVGGFRLQPALRFARRSESVQGYEGIKGNQNPFKKGDKIPGFDGDHGTTDYGLGGSFGFREMASLLIEWETSGHSFDADTNEEYRYNRFSLGLEQHVDRLPIMHFPEGMRLALRAGWTWREERKERPGYADFQFTPFVPSPLVPTYMTALTGNPNSSAGYGAFHLGFGLVLLGERVTLDGLFGFPGQVERFAANRTSDASGTEFGLRAAYHILN
ncbi:MAG: hypothetical protein JWP91_3853 [Fibrobacteres bacterium]|nr:hypothetical protein [Fibrobacterota bacterium]